MTPQYSSLNLVDNFHRQLSYLRLSITDFCNFRCDYCLPDGYTANAGKRPDNELSVSEIDVLIQAFAKLGTTKVRLTGGEPSIRQDLSRIIELAKQTQDIQTVAVSSNGYRLAKHLSDWQTAGLNQLNISIDSFDPTIFKQITGFDILPTLLKDIDTLLATTDIKLKLNGILMADTAFDNLQSVLSFVKNRPVTYRFIEFMQTSDNKALFFAQHSSGQRIKDFLLQNGWQSQRRASDAGPAIEYRHADYVGGIGLIEPYAPQFCDSCNRLRVSSQGKVHLCLFDNGSYDVRAFLANGDVDGLVHALQSLMPIKPEHHLLKQNDSGIMANLSMIGG
ncbi:cyclic pyranopterin phosphate synthase [Moraxella osloensis]|uniref:GTP 3',8-cyclase n=1 Tax=Faucicola osloensis TaxID=34062 RepID=A0AA91FIA4_FAUOS|nr:GTP 3',8-cyclase MoaA [Moraxella osloensis]OBX63240.1 cyclic pyranopterin phosphate synthase [Moraxella osloensis]